MSYCVNCGQILPEGAKFCARCGAAVNEYTNGNEQQRTIDFDGEIHKCPSCGETLNSFISNCPACGYELRNNRSSDSITAFTTKLNDIDSDYSINSKAKRAFNNKINLIKQYAIPNSKEDITEFFMLAYSNINTDVYGLKGCSPLLLSQKKESDAWLNMFDQTYQKALIVFGSSHEFVTIRNLHDNVHRKVKRKKWQLPIYFAISILVVIVLFVLMEYLLINASTIIN